MLLFRFIVLEAIVLLACCAAANQSTRGIHDLADRLFNGRGYAFDFSLTADAGNYSRWNQPTTDNYTVSAGHDGKIHVSGTTLSALARGLRHYAADTLHLDEFWFIDRRKISEELPLPSKTLTGSSTMPWRYNLNTVTFSYTFVWYDWYDWEKLLDWAALRGVNLQLAWVGYEKIFRDSFRDLGMTDDEVISFFSGPAFQSWNRFGNTKGSWGGAGNLSVHWIEAQFDMQKRIVARMSVLGITPVLPAFPGFVPEAISRVRPNASVTRGSDWTGESEHSKDLFLSPLDATYAELQKLFVEKQMEAFGNITNIYTLDQFNELAPGTGDVDDLRELSSATYKSLTAANPAAIWLMQGWLFYNSLDFWTQERIDAFLGGTGSKTNMLILDLYSENNPQWKRTKSYSGRPWIWCQLHNFGGNMNLFGQISKITEGPVAALNESASLVGLGLTPEGYEGNEVVYDLLFDQAWSKSPIDTEAYFSQWVTVRYGGVSRVPKSLHRAWELLREPVFDSISPDVPATGVGVYQLQPSLSGLTNRTGHFPAPTVVHYDPQILKEALRLMLMAGVENHMLWRLPAFELDVVDVLRQIMSNSFIDRYDSLVLAFNSTMNADKSRPGNKPSRSVREEGTKLLELLDALDLVLSTNEHFTMEKWLRDAKRWANQDEDADLVAFNARSQVSVWFWEVSFLNDYSARAWSGLTLSYYYSRWSIFIDGLENATKTGSLDEAALTKKIRKFEKEWQYGGFELHGSRATENLSLRDTVHYLQDRLPEMFT